MDGDTPAYISKFYINYSNDKKVWDYSAKNIWGFKVILFNFSCLLDFHVGSRVLRQGCFNEVLIYF